MSIDENELDSKIVETETLHQQARIKEKEIRDILGNLDAIKKIKTKVPMPVGSSTIGTTKDHIVMELPIDDTTGQEITPVRRTVIFNEQKRRLTEINV